MKNKIIITAIILIAVVIGGYLIFSGKPAENNNMSNQATGTPLVSELKTETLKEGAGAEAKNGDELTVHYVGTLLDGTKFDSSVDRDQPFSFTLGARQVIDGWEQGILGMKVGEKRKITIPPSLGYGQYGSGPIPPNATLIFEVELLKIN